MFLIAEAMARLAWWAVGEGLEDDWRLQYPDYERLLASEWKQSQVTEILKPDVANYIRHDAVLGWSIRSNASSGIYKSNSIGARSDTEYAEVQAPGIVRFTAYGDSFTHADHVTNPESWPALWESMNPRVEVVNFGVSGYGTDQAYLRYRENADQIDTDVVLIGVMSENINRTVNTYIPFYRPDSWPSTKPRFILGKNGELDLVANHFQEVDAYKKLLEASPEIIDEIGEHDYWYQAQLKPHWSHNSRLIKMASSAHKLLRYSRATDADGQYNVNSPHFKILVKIIERFAEDVRKSGAHPVVVVFADNYSYKLPYFDKTGEFMHAPLLAHLENINIDYVDVSEGFLEIDDYDIDALMPGHYSAEGNQVAASYLDRELAPLIRKILLEKEAMDGRQNSQG